VIDVFELPSISYRLPFAVPQEEMEFPSLGCMVTEGLVPTGHHLIATLSFSGIMEHPIRVWAIEVAVLFATGRVAKDHNYGTFSRGADAALSLSSKRGVEITPHYWVAGLETETGSIQLAHLET
jgi:hypothetical protein